MTNRLKEIEIDFFMGNQADRGRVWFSTEDSGDAGVKRQKKYCFFIPKL